MPTLPFKIAHPFVAIAWSAATVDQPVRVCLLARTSDADGGMELVALNRFSHGSSFLAALVDQDRQVVEWLEYWVQGTEAVEDSPAARCGLLSNVVLDQAWDSFTAAMRNQNTDGVIASGWERRPAEALAIDIKSLVVTRWIHPTARQPWVLCTDDAALTAAAKSQYSTSSERWFSVKLPSGETAWLEQHAFVAGTFGNGLAVPEAGDAASVLPLNPSGGKMALWRLPPLRLERFADALRPKSIPGGNNANADTAPPPPLDAMENAILGRDFCADVPGFFQAAPALERLYLSLALWHSTVAAVYSASQALGRPFFNIGLDSFRIDLLPAGSLMPRPWSFRTVLAKPGQAVTFPVAGAEPAFVPAADVLQSAAVARFGGSRGGPGTVRLSQISDVGEGQIKLEGFIDAAPLRDISDRTIVWIQLPLEGQSLSFTASLEADLGAARAGTRFKAAVKQIAPAALKQLKAALSPRRACQYMLLQSVSPALDVYSLGLVGIRILLANDAHAMGEIEDDFFEIAALLPRDSAVSHLAYLTESADTNERLRRLLNPRDWVLNHDGTDAVPREIWHGVIHELMEFVAVEEEHQVEPDFATYAPSWLQVLAQRERGLRNLTLHVRGVLSAPQVAHEEISKVVLRFVGGR